MSSLVFNMVGGGGGIKLSSLVVTSAPTKTSYMPGEVFSTSGMVITATYSNGATRVLTDYSYSPSGALSLSDTKITISYTEYGVTAITTQAITVAKVYVAIPSQSGTLTYSGSSQTPSWSNYDSSKMTIGGTTSGTNAGSYSATFTLKNTTGYAWSDETTAAKTVAWSIGRATISTVPSQSGTLTYTGSSLSPTWSNYDSGKMVIGGTTSGTNAGSYNATFTPNNNYKWSDSTTTAKSVNWTIAKATGSLSISKTSITLNSSTTSTTFTVTRSGNGTISVSSNNTSVATVSLSGTTVTVKSVNSTSGSATITVSVAAGTNYTAPASKTCSVTASFMPVKGNIISVNMTGSASNYRVLSVSGTVVKLLGMTDIASKVYDGDNTTTTMGGITVQKYASSDLDTYLNTTWYNTLSTTAKDAIVAQTITQDAWYWNSSGSPSYSGTYGTSVPGTSSYTISKYAGGTLTVGSRYVYALGVQDIIDYLNDGSVQVDTSAILRNVNIWKMYWNTTTKPSNYSYPWLRSAYADGSYYAWHVYGYDGRVVRDGVDYSLAVRPAFNLDLSKISYTIVE